MSGQRKERDESPFAGGQAHMLTFDVEEYFQVEAAAASLAPDKWDSVPKRLAPCVDRILALLAEHEASATFFVLGWVARHEADLVRKIADAGYEIASHGMDHRMVGRLTPAEFLRDLLDSRSLLEDISGRPVVGYRAPTFSITRETAWALDVLAEAGFRYDSSIFPVHHDRYGVPDAPRWAHRAAGPGGGRILEIPPMTIRLLGHNLPVGGGGYLRLFPIRMLAGALSRAERKGRSGMIYLHPWELDPDQPELPMTRLSRWRQRVGLRRTEAKLRRLMRRFRFTSIIERLDTLAEDFKGVFSYGPDGS